MATVRKREWTTKAGPKTAWIADYFDQAGKRHVKTFKTKKAADAWLVGTRYDVAEGTHTAESASITIAEACELWLQKAKLNDRERSTQAQYSDHVEHHIKPLIGQIRLSNLSTPMVQKFADDLLGRPFAKGSKDPKGLLSRAMAQKVLTSLKGVIKEAQRQGKVARNAAEPVSVKVPKRGAIKIRPGRDFPS
jgi:integrase